LLVGSLNSSLVADIKAAILSTPFIETRKLIE
jgi:hypothetical protein